MKYLIKQREKRKGEERGRETVLYMMTQAYDPNTQGAETGASQSIGLLGFQNEFEASLRNLRRPCEGWVSGGACAMPWEQFPVSKLKWGCWR